MILGSVTSVPLLLVSTVAYPAYRTFKAVESKDATTMARWLQYWMLFAVFSTFEGILDLIGAYLPLYYETKLCFMLWLVVDRFEGASVLYQKYASPLLLKYQEPIDGQLKSMEKAASNFKVEDIATFMTWAVDSFNKVKGTEKPAPAADKPAAAKKVEQKEKPLEPDETHETEDAPVDISSEEAKKVD